MFLRIKFWIECLLKYVVKEKERASMELPVDRLWQQMKSNPDKLYFTDAEKKAFRVIVHEDYFEVLRIDPDRVFLVRQRLTKDNLAEALRCNPKKLSDISDRIRGASYCYAVIKAYC